MTRDEWIKRYVKRMMEGGSWKTEQQLIYSAEGSCDETEAMGYLNPDDWEDPDTIAEEHLESE